VLKDRDWQVKYTPEDGDLVRVFYVPALQDTARYDRLTGYFDRPAAARLDVIRYAPSLPAGAAEVGAETAAIDPWPHQVRAFERLYTRWPPKLLIADEVGLGKTIQAGLLLRQAWLAGRNSIPGETHREPARVRPSVPWSP